MPGFRRRPNRRPRHGLRWALLAVVVVGGVGAVSAYSVLQIARDLLVAKTNVESVERLLKAGQPAAARAAVTRAQAYVLHANSTLHGSPELNILKALPVARQNLDAMEAAVAVALRLTGGG